MWGGGIIHKYRSSTLVGLGHPEMALHAVFRTGSIFEACDVYCNSIRLEGTRANTGLCVDVNSGVMI